MPNLDTLLSFPASRGAGPSSAAERTPIPPRSSLILVTDTIDSPALFVLTHFLRASHSINKSHRTGRVEANVHVKANAKSHTKVIWLGCSSAGYVDLNNVARKSSVHLDQETRDGAFSYIDAGVELFTSFDNDSIDEAVATMHIREDASHAQQSLQRLYSKVAEQLQDTAVCQQTTSSDWSSRTLIVVDDLSALAWSLDTSDSTAHSVDVVRLLSNWHGALTCLATKHQACVISLMHADATSSSKNGASDRVDESLFNNLLQKADVWIEVKELVSGRARDCDGEITVHPLVRPSLARTMPSPKASVVGQDSDPRHLPPLQAFAIETPCPSRAKAVLYRITPDGQNAALGGASIGSNTGRVQVWARGTGRGFL